MLKVRKFMNWVYQHRSAVCTILLLGLAVAVADDVVDGRRID
jgi:hypothetical protein